MRVSIYERFMQKETTVSAMKGGRHNALDIQRR
jgi:hypothetical protein